MAVEHRPRAARLRLGDHHRMSRGGPNAELEADRGKVLGEMYGCPATSLPVGRVGRDRGDAQEGEEPFEATIEVLVDAIEHCVKAGHQPRSVNRLLLRL